MFSLSNNHFIQVLKIVMLHNFEQIIITKSVHQGISPKKEVVKLVKKLF